MCLKLYIGSRLGLCLVNSNVIRVTLGDLLQFSLALVNKTHISSWGYEILGLGYNHGENIPSGKESGIELEKKNGKLVTTSKTRDRCAAARRG